MIFKQTSFGINYKLKNFMTGRAPTADKVSPYKYNKVKYPGLFDGIPIAAGMMSAWDKEK